MERLRHEPREGALRLAENLAELHLVEANESTQCQDACECEPFPVFPLDEKSLERAVKAEAD